MVVTSSNSIRLGYAGLEKSVVRKLDSDPPQATRAHANYGQGPGANKRLHVEEEYPQ